MRQLAVENSTQRLAELSGELESVSRRIQDLDAGPGQEPRSDVDG